VAETRRSTAAATDDVFWHNGTQARWDAGLQGVYDLSVRWLPYTSMEGPGTKEAISGFGQRRIWEDCVMYKLISIILAAIPFILFLRTIFIGRLRRSQAVSDFRKQIDYLVWIILILIACGLIYREADVA
jgi:hypothetical protein